MPFKSGGGIGGRGNSGGISGDGGGTGIDAHGNPGGIFHHRSQFKNNARMKIRA